MSLNNVPSKVEVMGWNPRSLADYMRRLKLPDCDKLVMKGSITGAQFMQMTACDLQVFPSLYVPIITEIQSELNKEEQKSFGHESKAQKYLQQVFVQDEEVWDSDEFDKESNHDGSDEEDSYICPLIEPQTAEQLGSDETHEVNHASRSSADLMAPPRHPRVAQIQDRHYRDPVDEPTPAERTSNPPHPPPPRMSHTTQRPFKAPAGQPHLHIDRRKKPGQCGPSQTECTKSKGSTVKAPDSSTSKIPKHRVPKPTDESNRAGKLSPVIPAPTQPAKVNNSTPGSSKMNSRWRCCKKEHNGGSLTSALNSKDGLDPSWYGGKVTRHQAEVALREVNKDGAFMVRDSSQGNAEHPYTLMLLKRGKVYNIMIRNQGNSYSLGSGLKNSESFPGVKEMITHHTHIPLLLIDATDQGSTAHRRCCLLHPAGL